MLVLIAASCIFRFGGLTLGLDALRPFVCVARMRSFTIWQSFHLLFRCRICIPASQPGPQRSRPPDAGHPQASDRAGLPPACSAASPAGRVDQGRRRAPPLANEAARRRAGRARPQSSVDHHIHLPFTHDVCGANRGDPDGECLICG